MSDKLSPQTLTNFVKDYYKRFHKDILDEGVEHNTERFIVLFTRSCWERQRLLRINDKL